MTDVVDRAQDVEAEHLAEQIERQRRAAALDKPGAEVCADCADPIPEARRRALPSAVRCLACQDYVERVTKIKNNKGGTP